jgi:hypothetical protein
MSIELSRRRFVESALAAGLLVPGGVGGLVSIALAQGAPAQGIRRMRGQVMVNGQPVREGASIKPGEAVITTGPKSFATFVVGQDAFLLRGNSKLELSGTSSLVNLVRVVTGKLLSVYAKGMGPRRIEGSVGTIGIRGTGAYIESEPDKTYFCLCYGEAEIVANADPQVRETVHTVHHDSPRYIYAKGAAKLIDKAPVINHKDDELILLESLVGRTPAFIDTDEYKSGVRY